MLNWPCDICHLTDDDILSFQLQKPPDVGGHVRVSKSQTSEVSIISTARVEWYRLELPPKGQWGYRWTDWDLTFPTHAFFVCFKWKETGAVRPGRVNGMRQLGIKQLPVWSRRTEQLATERLTVQRAREKSKMTRTRKKNRKKLQHPPGTQTVGQGLHPGQGPAEPAIRRLQTPNSNLLHSASLKPTPRRRHGTA